VHFEQGMRKTLDSIDPDLGDVLEKMSRDISSQIMFIVKELYAAEKRLSAQLSISYLVHCDSLANVHRFQPSDLKSDMACEAKTMQHLGRMGLSCEAKATQHLGNMDKLGAHLISSKHLSTDSPSSDLPNVALPTHSSNTQHLGVSAGSSSLSPQSLPKRETIPHFQGIRNL